MTMPDSARSASDQAIPAAELTGRMAELPGWVMEEGCIRRTWTFKDFYQAMAFVNAVAWVSHQQDHHPEMQVGYQRVSLSYSTHSSGGISEKDLICAAKVARL